MYQIAFAAAIDVCKGTKEFPREERQSLSDQVRRSSRSVCANLTEAWRKRRYAAAFVSKLNDAEGEAAEAQTWVRFAVPCGYWTAEMGGDLHQRYDHFLGKLVNMITNADPWLLPRNT